MNPGHAVDGMGANHAEVCHVDPLAISLLDHRHPSEAVNVPRVHGCHMLPECTESHWLRQGDASRGTGRGMPCWFSPKSTGEDRHQGVGGAWFCHTCCCTEHQMGVKLLEPGEHMAGFWGTSSNITHWGGAAPAPSILGCEGLEVFKGTELPQNRIAGALGGHNPRA